MNLLQHYINLFQNYINLLQDTMKLSFFNILCYFIVLFTYLLANVITENTNNFSGVAHLERVNHFGKIVVQPYCQYSINIHFSVSFALQTCM